MSDDLSDVQERRLLSLKLLLGTASQHIAPTSEQLAERLRSANVSMSNTTLSNLFLRKAAIKEPLATNIEIAMNVGKGWLSEDHTSYLRASAEDIQLVKRVLSLSSPARRALGQLLDATMSDAEPLVQAER